ncbi:MAG: lyase family protein, partial [Cytophagales bacterium]
MKSTALTAISPVDGRYYAQTESLRPYFSEFGLIRYRVLVEVEYFIALTEIPLPQLKDFPSLQVEPLRNLYKNFDVTEAEKIKQIEKTTNHDVKAVEYFLKQEFDRLGLSSYKEFIHFGLTSQDINNTATPLLLKEFLLNELLPLLEKFLHLLTQQSKQWKDVAMLARTHGQPASPTRLGKELEVFCARLKNQLELVKTIPYAAKFGGATGNFNA